MEVITWGEKIWAVILLVNKPDLRIIQDVLLDISLLLRLQILLDDFLKVFSEFALFFLECRKVYLELL